MKKILFICFLVSMALAGELQAQDQQAAIVEKMKVFANWVGHWKGEGAMQVGPGEPKTSVVDEHIQFKLDGTIVLVEGIGKATDDSGKEQVVHHALAVLSFDQQSGEYKFRSYLQDGRSTDAWLKVVGKDQYQWGFDTPRGKIRYSIAIDPAENTWHETGEFSSEGATWRKFFEMNLTKAG